MLPRVEHKKAHGAGIVVLVGGDDRWPEVG